MKSERDWPWERLASRLAGECSGDDAAAVDRWVEEDDSRREVMLKVQRLWDAAQGTQCTIDVDAAWRKVAPKLGGPAPVTEAPHPQSPTRLPPLFRVSWWSNPVVHAATAVAIAAGVVLASWSFARRAAGGGGLGEQVQISSQPAEQIRTLLSDGSQLQLNVASTLRLGEEYGRARREVYLEGEAYFEVVSDAERPFLVYANGSVTEVLGTSFVVRAYPGQEDVRVIVVDGTVSLRDRETAGGGGSLLTRGQLGRVLEGRAIVQGEVDVTRYLGWLSGNLIFNDTPVNEVARDLERWFDIQVVLRDSGLCSRRLTASFKGESLDQVLEVIALALEVDYDKSASGVVLTCR